MLVCIHLCEYSYVDVKCVQVCMQVCVHTEVRGQSLMSFLRSYPLCLLDQALSLAKSSLVRVG